MNAGKLREAVAFDAPSGIADGLGGTTVAWSEAHACRAAFVYGKGDEQLQAARLAGRQGWKVCVRACDATRAITTDYQMRDTRRSTVWNITDVDAVTDRAYVWLRVEGPVVR